MPSVTPAGQPPRLRQAAVLVPLFRGDDGEIRVVLVRRGPGGIHGGQLAFPGGNLEPDDASLLETALRESAEEIGLDREHVTVLEALSVFETRTSNYAITPFLARVTPARPWRIHEAEIAEVLEVPIADLTRPGVHGESVEQFPTWKQPQRISFYRIGEHRLWGATYRILHPLIPRIAAGEWEI